MKRPASLVAVLGALCACHSSTLVADGPVTVLENPYPAGYPSTNPMPNSIVATLPAGERVKVRSVGFGKGFQVLQGGPARRWVWLRHLRGWGFPHRGVNPR